MKVRKTFERDRKFKQADRAVILFWYYVISLYYIYLHLQETPGHDIIYLDDKIFPLQTVHSLPVENIQDPAAYKIDQGCVV